MNVAILRPAILTVTTSEGHDRAPKPVGGGLVLMGSPNTDD
jgi:hypothetical protein